MSHGGRSKSQCRITAARDQVSEKRVGLSLANSTSGAWHGLRTVAISKVQVLDEKSKRRKTFKSHQDWHFPRRIVESPRDQSW